MRLSEGLPIGSPIADQDNYLTRSSNSNPQGQKSKEPITDNDAQHYAKPLPDFAVLVRIFIGLQNCSATDFTLTFKITLVHAMIIRFAGYVAVVNSVLELIDHHGLEDVSLVVDIVKDI